MDIIGQLILTAFAVAIALIAISGTISLIIAAVLAVRGKSLKPEAPGGRSRMSHDSAGIDSADSGF